MSNGYDFTEPATTTQEGNVTVNVAAPAPAAPAAPPAPMATDAQVDAFLGKTPAATPAGKLPATETYKQDPEGGTFVTGLLKGAGRDVLGALSLLPVVGDYFTRESWLGQRAYAPTRGIGESVGEFIGETAPYVAGGWGLARAALSPATLSRIYSFSPSLSRVISPVFGSSQARTAAGRFAAAGTPRVPLSTPTSILGKSAVGGAVAGLTREPEGDPSYAGRIAPAVAGGVTGAALGLAGPALQRATQTISTNMQSMGINPSSAQGKMILNILTGMGGLAMHDISGNAMLTVATMYALHNTGIGVRAAHALAPLVAQQAAILGRGAIRTATVAGAAAGDISSDVGKKPK